MPAALKRPGKSEGEKRRGKIISAAKAARDTDSGASRKTSDKPKPKSRRRLLVATKRLPACSTNTRANSFLLILDRDLQDPSRDPANYYWIDWQANLSVLKQRIRNFPYTNAPQGEPRARFTVVCKTSGLTVKFGGVQMRATILGVVDN
jgi:hypothetical protein